MLEDGISLPDVTNISSSAGALTQETFYDYYQHFVASVLLPQVKDTQLSCFLMDMQAIGTPKLYAYWWLAASSLLSNLDAFWGENATA